ncbi:hypothetical protein ASE70_05595 [Sphingomonas sp. Leaf22]|uniref:phage tail assembly protein n=1 Tax=Sphingomonas sp. Leaf22 TaxID=1735687 RepID=UPI0006F45000|nr:phage tail assembly protein [Sphingomonas sp. Leaf22]KQM79342.1 hypothetical protein ASE70_05595 [Sphingomonas sp. Leaf22]
MTKLATFALQSAIVVAGTTAHPAGTEITVRQPKAGELRGLSTNPLIQGDYTALETLAPRITSPAITKQQFAEMDPADLTQFHLEVLDFLLPSAAKQAVSPTE